MSKTLEEAVEDRTLRALAKADEATARTVLRGWESAIRADERRKVLAERRGPRMTQDEFGHFSIGLKGDDR